MAGGYLMWTGDGDGGGISLWLALLGIVLPCLLILAALSGTIYFFASVFVQSFFKNPFRSSSSLEEKRDQDVTTCGWPAGSGKDKA